MAIPALAVAAGFAVAGGGLAAMQANAQNASLKRQARNQMHAIDEETRQSRIRAYEESRILAAQTHKKASSVRNAIGLGYSGNAIEYLASIMVDGDMDQRALRRNQEQFERIQQIRKQNAATGAEAQSVSPGLAALQGGLSGAQTGLNFANSINSVGTAQREGQLIDQQLELGNQKLDFNAQLNETILDTARIENQIANDRLFRSMRPLKSDQYITNLSRLIL